MEYILYNGELYHHGIKGQKWGVRRYQNPDGTLTDAGQKRYYGKADRIQRDIDSFKGHESGIRTKSGKLVLSSDDVKNAVKGLESVRDKERAKGDARRQRDAQKVNNRVAKGNAKLEKELGRVEKARDKTLAARAKNYEKLSNRVDKKVKSGTGTQLYADYRKKDFELGTKAVSKGYDRYAKTIKDYKSMKISAINDPSVKKSEAYKEAGKAYRKQLFSDSYYGGMSMTVLMYAGEAVDEVEGRK